MNQIKDYKKRIDNSRFYSNDDPKKSKTFQILNFIRFYIIVKFFTE